SSAPATEKPLNRGWVPPMEPPETGTLRVIVTDVSGAGVLDAKVTVTSCRCADAVIENTKSRVAASKAGKKPLRGLRLDPFRPIPAALSQFICSPFSATRELS